MQCPKCSADVYEHWYRDKGVHEYNGPSEIRCRKCDYREGYFCHRELTGDEVEPFDCKCDLHPKFVVL